MSSAGISFGGLASGLDTQAIIAALVAVEERPIFALERSKTSLGKQKGLFGNLSTLLDKLSDAAKALETTSSFLQMKAISNNEDILTASASSTATPGNYGVKVWELAKGQINSAGAASASTAIANSTSPVSFSIDIDGTTHFISANNDLNSIASAINSDAGLTEDGVRAEIVDTGSGAVASERYQLVIRSDNPGTDNSFTISYDDGGTGFADLITNLNTDVTDATDSHIEVNGLQIYRSTNTISDLFGGVTFDLNSAAPRVAGIPEEVTITVATDGEETSTKVKELVDAYNAVVDFFEAQNSVDEEGTAKSPIFGDTTMRSMRSSLRSIVGGSVLGTGNEAFQLLSQIGISSDTKGKLEFNQSKFEEALAEDENAVSALFSNTAGGIAGRLEDQIDLYTDSVDGLLKTRNDGFDRRIKEATNRIEDAERRLVRFRDALTVKYANLEVLLSRLQGQGSSVNNIAAAFGN
ncbi:MAG: flagellar hook-associated protein 2 [Hyphomicrobiaceae bacterium]|jgi:flagellar hook-associated protein 2